MDDLKTALTFDDVLLRPRYAGFLRSNIDLGMQLTPRVKLRIPLISAPMDTVTESKLAIKLAEAGGLGIIHRNMNIENQAREVRAVKTKGLSVGAAVGSSPGFEARVKALVKAGVDVLVVDSAHGHSLKVITTLAQIKDAYDIDVIAGNVATEEGARALINAGADALRVGMGPGAICTTRIVSGMGVPQLTALIDTARAAGRHRVPVIADGGLNNSGDVVKALAAGASAVMFGRMFAACKESPGKITTLKANEVPDRFKSIINGNKEYLFKEYRGMGSVAAMKQGIKISSEDEFHGKDFKDEVLIAEGVEGMVPCSGTVQELMDQIVGGVMSGMYYVGSRTIPELWDTAQFMRITQASLHESHPHDLFVTNPGANYF